MTKAQVMNELQYDVVYTSLDARNMATIYGLRDRWCCHTRWTDSSKLDLFSIFKKENRHFLIEPLFLSYSLNIFQYDMIWEKVAS